MINEAVAAPECEGERLDIALVLSFPDVSRSRAQNLIKAGAVSVNGQVQKLPRFRISAGMTIAVEGPLNPVPDKAEPEDIPLDILYEDESVLVINKASGMVVHPAAGNWHGTIVNAVLGHDPELGVDDDNADPLRPGIVHRLDKDTSGTLVIAKTPRALRVLSKAFADRTVEKTYLALVHGWPVPPASVIHTDIARHPVERKKMAVVRTGTGREAYTAYRTLKQGYWGMVKTALLQVRLHTGRTHQIRVHMSYVNYPLLGDTLYNRGRASNAPRQMLHAWKLSFPHPETGEMMSFEAPLPDDMKAVIDAISPERTEL